jgi:hypothetical protein
LFFAAARPAKFRCAARDEIDPKTRATILLPTISPARPGQSPLDRDVIAVRGLLAMNRRDHPRRPGLGDRSPIGSSAAGPGRRAGLGAVNDADRGVGVARTAGTRPAA